MITLRPLIKGRGIRMACTPSIIHRDGSQLQVQYIQHTPTSALILCTVGQGRVCTHACCMHSHSTVSQASSWSAASSAAGWCLSGFSVKSLPQPPSYSTAEHTQHITLTNPHSPRDPTFLIHRHAILQQQAQRTPSLPSNQISS